MGRMDACGILRPAYGISAYMGCVYATPHYLFRLQALDVSTGMDAWHAVGHCRSYSPGAVELLWHRSHDNSSIRVIDYKPRYGLLYRAGLPTCILRILGVVRHNVHARRGTRQINRQDAFCFLDCFIVGNSRYSVRIDCLQVAAQVAATPFALVVVIVHRARTQVATAVSPVRPRTTELEVTSCCGSLRRCCSAFTATPRQFRLLSAAMSDNSAAQVREGRNPVATHPEGTEELLLEHVLQKAVDASPASVMEQIDQFGWQSRWVMCLGDVKGKFLDDAIMSVTPKPCKLVLELGLYCGYSSTRLASQLPDDGKVYTIEPSDKHREIANQILTKAGVRHKVNICAGTAEEVIPQLAEQGLKFDLVFIDHKKELYLSDLKLIEKHGLMRPGTVVVADNVVIFKLQDYLAYVRGSGNYSSSTLHRAHVEYSNEVEDGVEVSVYAG